MVDRPRPRFLFLKHMPVHNELCPNIASFPLAAGEFHHLLYRPGRVSLRTRICKFATAFSLPPSLCRSLGVQIRNTNSYGVVCLVSSTVLLLLENVGRVLSLSNMVGHSIATILLTTCEYGVPHTGPWLLHVLEVMFWVYISVGMFASAGMYLILWSTL